MTALDVALGYIQRGWCPIPVPHRSKKPNFRGWEKLRLTPETAPQYFNGMPQNVSVILGEPSRNLVDLDLDCAEAIIIAHYIAPKTCAIFGRESSRASHSLYYADSLRESGKIGFLDPVRAKEKDAVLVELRGGLNSVQTVFPGSVHEIGEPISWESGCDGEPATAPFESLLTASKRIAALALMARYMPG